MAKLFEEIFTDQGSGDILLLVRSELPDEADTEETLRLRCHSLILTQHPYFCKMLRDSTPLREGLRREIHVCENHAEFVELLRFMYTNHIEVKHHNVAGLLTLADKYCIDEVMDICLKFIKDNFDSDIFFAFYNFTALDSAYQDKLREHLMAALRQRCNLWSITEDQRWQELPVAIVELILSQDDLPIESEAEILTLIARWLKGKGAGSSACIDIQDVARLLGTFRKTDSLYVHVPDVQALMHALGKDFFSERVPRTGASIWDPSFVRHSYENKGSSHVASNAYEQCAGTQMNGYEPEKNISHLMGPRDSLYQEPGWMDHPGNHRCRIVLVCNSWSHRERRLFRSNNPNQVAALQKRGFEMPCQTKPAGHERSPSPPPAFQSRFQMPNYDSLDTSDNSPLEQRQGSAVLGGGVMSNMSHDKIDHELVDHQIVVGISSGQLRHGVRISQRERSAIYLVQDLQGKQSLNFGGTTTTVSFDIEIGIGDATKYGIRRCRFAMLRNMHTLFEEFFDVSAKMPLRTYISSMNFDNRSSYTVDVRWLRPGDRPCGQAYVRQQ